MPELPDIAAHSTALESRVVGQKHERGRLASPFLLRITRPALSVSEGRGARELRRRMGKRIAIGPDGSLWLVLHLTIAGRLHWKPARAALRGRTGRSKRSDPARQTGLRQLVQRSRIEWCLLPARPGRPGRPVAARVRACRETSMHFLWLASVSSPDCARVLYAAP